MISELPESDGLNAMSPPEAIRLDEALCKLLRQDFELPRRRRVEASAIDDLVSSLLRYERPVAYTAFDGDHFALIPGMRHLALANGRVPANPESILGYKEVVDAHLNKRAVLLDDLAILRGCDELWVFTDVPPTPRAIAAELAEGVLTELLWFLSQPGPRRPVYFIPTDVLFQKSPLYAHAYTASLSETKSALSLNRLDEVVQLIEHIHSGMERLRPVVYFSYDPLDGKYVDWLRAQAYVSGLVPLVPGLAVELRDGAGVDRAPRFVTVVHAWLSLMILADEMLILPPADPVRERSSLVDLLAAAWNRRPDAKSREARWQEFQIPKIHQGGAWPLSRREGAL